MYRVFKINELGEQSVKHLYLVKDQIDFFPYYQRFGNIWSLKKKQLLIDTIINKFDIPKFYLNYFVETNNNININNALYAIIDGKQRLQAIFDYLEDKFPLDEHCIFLDDSTVQIKGLKYSELLSHYPQIATLIGNYVLDVVFITTDDEDRLEELFLRLNGGVALTNAEKRNAISSFINDEIRSIIKTDLFFTTKIKFNNPRYQYNDLLSKLLYIESNQRLVNLGNKELEDFLRFHSLNNAENNLLISQTSNVLRKMETVFLDKDNLLKSKGLIPVYYQFIKDKLALTSPDKLRTFFEEFETIKVDNRRQENPNPILQEFDRLNQQGVHREKSLDSRYKILQDYFEEFLAKGGLTKIVDMPYLDVDDTDNYDDF